MLKKIIFILVCAAFCLSLLRPVFADEKEDELFFVAQKAFEDGFYDVALRYLDRFLKDYPQTSKRAQVELLIGQCYFFDNQYLKAFDQFGSLLKSPEGEEIKDAVLFWLGEVYLKSKDYKQAETYYKRLIEEYPVSTYLSQGFYSLGWTYFEQGLYEEAIAAFSEIIKKNPSSTLIEDCHFKIGESLYNLKQYHDSILKFTAYLKKYPQSNRLDQVYFYIGEANYYLENFEAAVSNYSQVITISKDDRLANMTRTSSGWSYLRLKKYKEAQDIFQEALMVAQSKNLEIDDILLGKGSLFTQTEDYERALAVYNEMINKLPASRWFVDAKLGKANCLHELGRYDEAVTVYNEILSNYAQKKELADQIEKVYFGLAWSNLKLGKYKESIDNFQEVINSSTDKTLRISALCQIGDIYQDIGDLQLAVDTYDRVLKDSPESLYNDYIQYREGIALLKMDRVDAATLIFQSLSKNFPKSRFISDAQYYLGMAYFKKGDFLASKEQFEGLLSRLPKDAEFRSDLLFALGTTLGYLKEYKKAVDIFEKIKKDYAQNSDLLQKSDFEIANSLYQWGKDQDAVKKFKLIVYKYPKTPVTLKTLLWLGDYYLKTGKFEMSKKYLNDLLADYAESDKIDEAYYLIGQNFKEEKKYDEAVNEFRKILSRNKGEMAIKASLAIAGMLSETSKMEEAAQIYNDIILKYPDAAREAYVRLADLYYKNGSFKKAIDTYQSALNLGANDSSGISAAQIQFGLAESMEGANDLNRAIENYLKIPYLYPQEVKWVVKSYLRVAKIYEDKENWTEARKIYEKVARENVEEAKFASEKLEWINANIRKR